MFMKIGERIRNLRKDNKMTQTELANFLGVSVASVALWENEKRQIDVENIVKVARIFCVTTDFLLGNIAGNEIILIDKNGTRKHYFVNDEQLKAIEEFLENALKEESK